MDQSKLSPTSYKKFRVMTCQNPEISHLSDLLLQYRQHRRVISDLSYDLDRLITRRQLQTIFSPTQALVQNLLLSQPENETETVHQQYRIFPQSILKVKKVQNQNQQPVKKRKFANQFLLKQMQLFKETAKK
ncbi:Hypothetical_protein [Hexamita inflata]|uniref:Hypothetical_protein n=1 Tax=Hexamita inflata TaxID=28002 RepID=A0ABP1H6P4_9EUKA